MNVSNVMVLRGGMTKKKPPHTTPGSILWLYLILISKLAWNQKQPRRMGQLGEEAPLNAVNFSHTVTINNSLSLSRLPVQKVKPRKQRVNIVTSQGKGKISNRQRSL